MRLEMISQTLDDSKKYSRIIESDDNKHTSNGFSSKLMGTWGKVRKVKIVNLSDDLHVKSEGQIKIKQGINIRHSLVHLYTIANEWKFCQWQKND